MRKRRTACRSRTIRFTQRFRRCREVSRSRNASRSSYRESRDVVALLLESSGGEKMTNHEPIKVTNLDGYGNPPLEWSRARTLLETPMEPTDATFFLGTSRPDGRPHAAPIGAIWVEGEIYFTSSPQARKARNL